MLGYVRAQMSELRMREYECYRSMYCGLCRHMGKCTGQCSRLSLSYDFVFLAAVRMSLSGEELKFKKKRCLVHPFKKRNTVIDSPVLRYCADASALLTYHKLRDDLADERGSKKLRARISLVFFVGGYRRAKKRYPALDASIAERLRELGDYEKNTEAPPSADVPASIFASLMEDVFSHGLDGVDARIASAIGRSVGNWIYLADAADDYKKDLESNSFNPYARLFGDDFSKERRASVGVAMTNHLLEADRAFALIDDFPTPEVKEILCNILYLGLPQTAEQILNETLKGEVSKHEKPV
ncbi:MAG: hypothetical protein E7643_05925 [Ruminococcaceae bacterium]|nr:hypothetical protein [Oscillospiraceae bacterium]